MPVKTLYYKNSDLTIVWKPEQCKHSALCWKGLHNVFDPARHPWINPDAAETSAIVEQIKKCPSGALSYVMNSHGNLQDEQS